MGLLRNIVKRFSPFLLAAGSQASASSTPPESRNLRARPAKSSFSIVAAQMGNQGKSKWTGSSDDYNREYAEARDTVVARVQDLDVNNPDIRGWHRRRIAQLIGKGLQFKAIIRPDETGLSSDQCAELNQKINHLRDLHSRSFGFDAAGRGRCEGKLMEKSGISLVTHGEVLVHKVYLNSPGRVSPLALEIIPATRLQTPHDKFADPKVSNGILYSDDRRTRVVGYYVYKPSKSMANTMVKDYAYDYLPADDVVLMQLTELAGIDRSLPAAVACVRMIRNKGEFIEAAVETAKVQSKRSGFVEVAENASPYNVASDDKQQEGETSEFELNTVGSITVGGTDLMYLSHGEKFINNAAKLPDPDYKGFIDVADERLARGLCTSKSRFTGAVTGSYSAGRQEEQQDEPVAAQLLQTIVDGWQRVHCWFVESLYLTGAIELPGYSSETALYFHQARAQAPGKVHINPVDTAAARQIGYGLRTLTPQQACEQDGVDLVDNLTQWGEALKHARDTEIKFGLPVGTLDYVSKAAKGVTSITPSHEDQDKTRGEREEQAVATHDDDSENEEADDSEYASKQPPSRLNGFYKKPKLNGAAHA